MSAERSLVPLPEEEPLLERGEVTSETFPSFLLGFNDNFPYKHWEFASELDLSYFSSVFEQLSQEKQQTYIFPEEIRTYWREQSTEHNSQLEDQDSHSFWNRTGDAERFTAILWDKEQECFIRTPIQHGHYSHVLGNLNEYWNDRNVPLLEVHTHPYDSLPSAVDYTDMITTGYYGGRATIRGIVVICPTFQILALPRSTTPVMSESEADQFIGEADEKYDKEFVSVEVERQKKLDDIYIQTMDKAGKSITQKNNIIAYEVDRRENDGALSQSEGEVLRAEIEAAMKEYQDKLLKYSYNLGVMTNIKFSEILNNIDNLLNMEFARLLDIEFFTATDLKHFKKWTA